MKKKILMSLFTIAIVCALIGGGVMAVFTDTETSGQNTFSTGTVVIQLNPNSSPDAIFTVSDMAPGDSETGTITVANVGTLDLRYAMTTDFISGNSVLAGQLEVEIIDAGSNVLYDGPLNAAFFGDSAQGQDGGDRFLADNTSEVLTFIVTLPLDTGDNLQGMTCDVSFVFHAEQTANN